MAASPPRGFITVRNALTGTWTKCSIIAVVVDSMPPMLSRGTSYVSTFTINDALDGERDGLKVRIFRSNPHKLPAPSRGDVVSICQLSLKNFRGLMGSSSEGENMQWAVFSKDATGSLTCSSYTGNQPTPDGFRYAALLLGCTENASLRHGMSRSQSRGAAGFGLEPSKSPGFWKKHCLIKDAPVDNFVDIVGEVVKKFVKHDEVELYVTDYTYNKCLFEYIDDGDGSTELSYSYASGYPRKWPGPFGRMTIQIILQDYPADWARNQVQEKMIVKLWNVNIKLTHYFRGTQTSLLRGKIRGDHLYPRKNFITILLEDDASPQIKDLIKRKAHYWEVYNSKQNCEESLQERSNNPTKGKKRRGKKIQDNQKKQKTQQERPSSLPTNEHKLETNKSVRTKNETISLYAISEIQGKNHDVISPDGIQYRLPYQNFKYRSCVRVVDFYPPKLEDFALPYNPHSSVADDGSESDDSWCGSRSSSNPPVKWRWDFYLLVEEGDASERKIPRAERSRLPLHVLGNDGEFLLNLIPTNLRVDPLNLEALKHKLFILWGDLQEKKAELEATGKAYDADNEHQISNRPFVCCIQEYGGRKNTENSDDPCENAPSCLNDGTHEKLGSVEEIMRWERRFHLFDTTIMGS